MSWIPIASTDMDIIAMQQIREDIEAMELAEAIAASEAMRLADELELAEAIEASEAMRSADELELAEAIAASEAMRLADELELAETLEQITVSEANRRSDLMAFRVFESNSSNAPETLPVRRIEAVTGSIVGSKDERTMLADIAEARMLNIASRGIVDNSSHTAIRRRYLQSKQ